MKAVKARLKEAEKTIKRLLSEDSIDHNYAVKKDKTHIYFPLKKGAESKYRELTIIDAEFSKRKMTAAKDLRTLLSSKLSGKDMERMKTGHDVIGDIAILEIDDELRKKEKLIAETLLKSNPSIKTVLRKADRHEGEFRTQKMKWLAGKKTTETIHKENGVSLKLDVEKVYFSPRLATERKRIAGQVKPGEEILCMFSGCAPYPLVLSKNTKARNITAVESNPEGHRYAMQNLKLNKANNIMLVNEDVKRAVPNILKYTVGLKSAAVPREMAKPLEDVEKTAHIYELHLFDEDLFEHKEKIEKAIRHLQSEGIRVFMHMPFKIYEKSHAKKEHSNSHKDYSLAKENIEKELEMLTILGELCRKYDAKAIVHPNSNTDFGDKHMVENLKKLEKYYDYFYFETLTKGFAHYKEVIRIGKAAGIRNVCIDIAHQYIIYKDNDRMVEAINAIKEEFNTYFHVADHNNNSHTCEIGRGFVDWRKIAPLINTGVLEIESKDYVEDKEQLSSHKTLNNYSGLRKFDRILMPLPKNAEDFLDTALGAAKKGAIIHFYDFLHEDNFKEAEEKVAKACKKAGARWKKLGLVKCGQHAPRVFRVCLDFKIL